MMSNIIPIRQELKEVKREPPLPPSGGGGTFDPMEARVSVLEANVGHIKEDLTEIRKDVRELRTDAKVEFRILFGAIITVALGLAGLMAHGFKWF